MERKEKWESLRLEAQKFAPHEYCKICQDQQVTVSRTWVTASSTIWEDSNQDHLINGDDFVAAAGHGTDNSGHATSITASSEGFRYVWWVNDTNASEVMAAVAAGLSAQEIWNAFKRDEANHIAGYGGGVPKPNGQSGHLFAGDNYQFSMS